MSVNQDPNLEPRPEIDPQLLKGAHDEAERLLEGVFGEVMDAPMDETGMPDDYSESYSEVYFPLLAKDDVTLVQQVTPEHTATQIKVRRQDFELSTMGRTVLVTETLGIDTDKDGKVIGSDFGISRSVLEGTKVVSEKLKDPTPQTGPFDPDNPEHLKRMLQKSMRIVEERAAMNKMGPKFDGNKVTEITDILKKLDVSNRTVIRGTEDVREIDLTA